MAVVERLGVADLNRVVESTAVIAFTPSGSIAAASPVSASDSSSGSGHGC